MTKGRNYLLRAAALALAACGLTACDDGVYVNRSELILYSGGNDVQSLGATGTNQVVVFNSPYAPDPTINAILDAARKRYTSNQFRFFAGAPIPEWNGYTLLVAFSDGPLGNQNLCKNRQTPLRPISADHTSLFVEYCVGDVLVSEVSAHSRPVKGVDDPQFAKLMGAAFAGVFEYRLPTSSGAGRFP